MERYEVLVQKEADGFPMVYTDREQAIKEAKGEWEHLTAYEHKHTVVSVSILDDDDLPCDCIWSTADRPELVEVSLSNKEELEEIKKKYYDQKYWETAPETVGEALSSGNYVCMIRDDYDDMLEDGETVTIYIEAEN